MRDKKQEMHSGDSSHNYQAKGDINVNGLTFDQAERLFMSMFKANFFDLQEEAMEIAERRAEEITNKYIEAIIKENTDLIEKTKSPDIRYDIYEAQKSYARSGDTNLRNLLVDLLLERTKKDDNTIVSIVLNEAISVAPKLTPNQIEILVIIFVIKHINFNSPAIDIDSYYYMFIEPYNFCLDNFRKRIDFSHLEYTSCISISMGEFSFENILKAKILKGINTVNEISPEAGIYEPIINIKNAWENTQLKHSSLSTVGLAIAITYYNIKTGKNLPYETWIN